MKPNSEPTAEPFKIGPFTIRPVTVFGLTFFTESKVITGCESSGTVGVPYLTRNNVATREDKPDRPGFAVYLHRFHRSDDVNVYHDHPYNFVSIPLWNGYFEETPNVFPNWNEDIKGMFQCQATRRKQMKEPYFAGWHTPTLRDKNGTIVAFRYPTSDPEERKKPPEYWLLEDETKLPPQPLKRNPGPSYGWKPVDPDEARVYHVRPLSFQRRPATYIHRVRLKRDKNGKEKPAITLVFRGPKIRVWGFWQNGIFTDYKTFFKENGC